MKYLFFLSLLFFFGCASDAEKTESKTYSSDTNRAFEMIERGGSYYLKKAPESTTPAPQVHTQAHSIPEKRRTVKPTLSPVEETPVVTETKHKTTKTDERLIEINQNLAFYCMKHRKDPRFGGDEATCMKFVNKTMTDCQSVHHIVNSKLLKCIQTQLRKK